MSTEEQKLSKTELLSKMREHQQQYAAYAAELKKLTAEEEHKLMQERQLSRLEEYKNKYTLYVQEDGSTKTIDWEEVEKLITSSFESDAGYALGFDQTGTEGLGRNYGNLSSFTPMVEDEVEARRYVEREKRRQEFIAKARQK